MGTKKSSIVCVTFCTILTALASFLFKIAMTDFQFSIIGIITNWKLILGLFLYGIGFIILAFALRNGELSVVYPIISLTYIWSLLLARFILHETVSYPEVIGVVIILLGVTAIGKGSTQKKRITLRYDL